MSLATYITFIRIFISPIFMLVYLFHGNFGINSIVLPYILFILMAVSELSDAFDGHFARKYNEVTDLGKILDPMADSIARLSVFLSFTQPPVNIPLAIVFIFLYRDSVISTLRTICALKGFTLAARISGKIKAVIQAIAAFAIVILMMLESTGRITTSELGSWSTWIVSIAALYTIYSGVDYINSNRMYIKRLLIKGPTVS